MKSGGKLTDSTHYRHFVGPLMHLANKVRPAIKFSVSYIERYMHRPSNAFRTA